MCQLGWEHTVKRAAHVPSGHLRIRFPNGLERPITRRMEEICRAWRSKSIKRPFLYSIQAVLINFAFSANILSRQGGELPAASLRKLGLQRFRTSTVNYPGSGMRNSRIRDDDLQKCCQRGLNQHQLNLSFATHSTSSPAFNVSLYHLRLAMLSSSRSIN